MWLYSVWLAILWFKYIDDIFVIWPRRKEKLVEFHHNFNSIHPNIFFTKEKAHYHSWTLITKTEQEDSFTWNQQILARNVPPPSNPSHWSTEDSKHRTCPLSDKQYNDEEVAKLLQDSRKIVTPWDKFTKQSTVLHIAKKKIWKQLLFHT